MYEISIIPNPPEPQHVHQFRALRLFSLGVEPSSFTSTDAEESTYTESTWRAHLTVYGIWTFAARQLPDDGWVGKVIIMAPQSKMWYEADLLSSSGDMEEDVYELVGLWVNPEHRRQGVGQMLIAAAVRRVEESPRWEGRTRVVKLEVSPENEGPMALYKRMGFVPGGYDKNGEYLTMSRVV